MVPARPAILRLGAAAALLAALVAAAIFRTRPPDPLGADAPADRFSAARAEPVLEALVGDSLPHPSGSPHNAVVRRRVVEALQAAGLEPAVQEGSVAGVRVGNVLARLRGSGPPDLGAVMLCAHYDSVADGPGAADDGASVAIVLEIARMLAAGPPPRRDVVFLVTDGEEIALLGARLFCAEHPWAKEIDVVVNLEARGTSGPSLMFQTSRPDAGLVAAFARSARRPKTGSLFAEVYRRMPNDTDLTVFLAAGMAGVNLAFIGGAMNYHTAQDDLAHLSRASLQHQGDNALGLVRALAVDVPPEQERVGDAVYFDVLGLAVIRWPAPWSVALALLAIVIVAAALHVAARAGAVRLTAVLAAAGLVVAIVAGSAALGLGIDRLARALGAIPSRPWPRHPVLLGGAFWGAALAWAVLVARLAGRRLGPWAWWGGAWAAWSLLALAAAAIAPAACYLVVAPTLMAGLAGLLAALVARSSTGGAGAGAFPAALAGAAAVALLWFPMEILFYQALGFGANLFLAARAGLVATSLALLFLPEPRES